MHDTAYKIGGLAMQLYCDLPKAAILEIGAQNVNGTLRDFILPTTRYVGLDIEAGQGVDIVMEAGASFPVGDSDFDLVMATSVFEHDPAFWMTFVEMCRKARPGGYVYINAPSNGAFHQYPHDHWRFYPDCGLALVKWAQSQGQDMELVETLWAERENGEWNDFVAVFRKSGGGSPLPDRLISDELPSTNVRTWRSEEILRPRVRTQDMELMRTWNAEIKHLGKELGDMQQQLQKRSGEVAELKQRGSDLEQARAATEQELTEARAKLSHLESVLAQRQEELSQAYAELADRNEAYNALEELLIESERLHEESVRKLKEADAWVFQLAAERKALQAELGVTLKNLGRSEVELRRLQTVHQDDRAKIHTMQEQAAELQARANAAEQRADHLQGDLQVEQAKVATRFEEIALITRMLREKEDELSALANKTEVEREASEHRMAALDTARQMEIARADSFASELNMERNRVSELEQAIRVSEDRASWLREVMATVFQQSSSRSLKQKLRAYLPAQFALSKAMAALKRNSLFDGDAYLEAHPDVAADDVNPLLHYVKHGMSEGRHPSRPS